MQRIGITAAIMLTAGALASAQGTNSSSEGRTAEQVYRNITALQGTPAGELNQSMHLMKGALGLDCSYCHIEGQWDRDDMAPKQVARAMILMMKDINDRQFGGRQVVTCYTCHNGRPIPASMPEFPVFEPSRAAAPALPTVDQILTRYVEALGGERAIRQVTSRVVTGTQYIPTGPGGTVPTPAVMERSQKAPNLTLTTYRTATFAISQGFDGTRAWSRNQAGRVADLVNLDTERARRAADFYEPLNLKQQYVQMTVDGVVTVNNRDTYLVTGVPPNDRPEQLYFDTRTGLLTRKVTVLPTPVGDSPFQMDFDDYRDAGNGVKVPFLIHMHPSNPRTELAPNTTLRVSKVEENLSIEDSTFAKPDAQ